MSAARAVLSAEWRAVRQEAIALSVAIVALPLLTRLVAPGAAKEGAAWLVGVLCALLAALVLGAGLFAGEAAPAFRAARPMGPMTSALVRLLVRTIVLAAILALGTIALVAWHPPIQGLAGGAAVGVAAGSILALLGAALASIFVERPIGATIAGAMLATVACVLQAIVAGLWFWGGTVLDAVFGGLTLVAPGMVLALVLFAKRASDTSWDRSRFLRRAGFIAVGGPIALLLVWVIAGNLLAEARLSRAIARLEAAHGPLPDPQRPEASRDARRADELAREIGFTLARREDESWRDTPELPRDLRRDLHESGVSLTPRVAEFLDHHESRIAELARILDGRDPRWSRTTLLGHWDLARILEADARRLAMRDPTAAQRNVRALRGLAQSLMEHPDGSLTGVSMLAREARLVRSIRAEASPPDWDVIERVVDGTIGYEIAVGVRDALEDEVPPASRLLQAQLRVLDRWDFAQGIEGEAQRNRWSTGCAALQLPERGGLHGVAPWDLAFGRWEAHVVRARLEWELTALAARVQSEREAGRPVPAEMLRSTTCPGESWVYAETESGWRLSVWPLPWREQWPPLVHEELAP